MGRFALTTSSVWRADGSVCAARRLASDITFNIMNAPVTGSPVMDELRRQAKEHCLDLRTLLGYSSYDSDDDSDRSVQRKDARVDRADRKVRGRTWLIDSVCNCLIYACPRLYRLSYITLPLRGRVRRKFMPPPPKENGIRNLLRANHYRPPQSRKSTRRSRL